MDSSLTYDGVKLHFGNTSNEITEKKGNKDNKKYSEKYKIIRTF